MKPSQLIGTVFGVGYIRPAPGTWGALVALPWAWLLHVLGGFPLVLVALVIVFGLGWWAAAQMARDTGNPDPSEVVVDEVIGQWIAILPLSWSAWNMGFDILRLWPGWIAAFLLFRLFDIWKPGPIGWLDRRGDTRGVILDDALAGVFAAVGVILLAGLVHGVMGL